MRRFYRAAMYPQRMPGPWIAMLALALAGCVTPGGVRFLNATPNAPFPIVGTEQKPSGRGPFPAVVLMHGCHGVRASTRRWGDWFQQRGYVALVVDSWATRGMMEGCSPASRDLPNTERFDDMVGALRFLHTRPWVDRERVGVIGWSNGGVYSISAINGPSHERNARRGVRLPAPGFRAAVAFYPGGCFSLVNEQVVRPLLVLIGGADDWTVPGPCIEMVDAMKSRGADVTAVVYPGVYHYFDVEEQKMTYLTDVENRNLPGECCGATVGYDAGAAADARRRVEEFFGYHLKRP
jgi:dienelactone hydrolase